MHRNIILLLLSIISYTACNSGISQDNNSSDNRELMLRDIKAWEDAILGKGSTNKDSMLILVGKMEAFSRSFQQDSLAPIMLFKGGDIAQGAGNVPLAIELWRRIQRDYKDFEKIPETIFMQAFTAETQLGDKMFARAYYSRLVKLYPKHPLAKEALSALKNLNKSDLEVIKSFEKED